MQANKSLSQREYFAKDQGELPAFLRKAFAKLPHEIVQPRSASEAVQAVRDACRAGVPIVPRGAASTAFGQTLPVRGGRVLDLGFMNAILGLDREAKLISVEAGVRWSDLAAYLDEKGLALGSHPSSFYTTVGGWIATGGLGLQTLKFGPIRSQVTRLRVCLAEGESRELTADDPIFDSFFETEGQMGLILEATLRVREKPEGSWPWLVPVDTLAEAWKLAGDAEAAGFELIHASIFNAERLRHFNHNLGKDVFAERPSALFHLEKKAESRRFHDWLRARGAVAAPMFQASYAWQERFFPLRGKRADQMFLGNEVVLEDKECPAYADQLSRLAGAAGVPLALEANAAGGGESVVIASFFASYGDEAAYVRKLGLVFSMDEAGHKRGARLYHVGVYNAPFLNRRFGEARLEKLEADKKALDPRGLFNPGKFFDMRLPFLAPIPASLRLAAARTAIALLRTRLGSSLAALAAPLLGKDPPARPSDKVFAAARECVSCGFCLPVCPAYLATRDERTTARGKLFLASKWLAGGKLSDDDVELLHSCMHCAGCTRVCQSTIDLVPVWYELEGRVAAERGRPTEAIDGFVRKVEASSDYRRLLRRGFIASPVPPGKASA